MDSYAQQRYQVRFDWGVAGAARIARDADVLVVVDELDGHGAVSRERIRGMIGGAVLPAEPVLLGATFGSAGEVASSILRLQADLGHRCMVAIVAAGAVEVDGPRFAVEDLLSGGAVVDALASLGLDASSPEAASACAAFVGLRGAIGHLFSASASAREVRAAQDHASAGEHRGLGEFSTPA